MIRIDFDPGQIGGSMLLGEAEITNLAGLKNKLQNGTNLSVYLREQLSSETLKLLDNDDSSAPSEPLRDALLADFNRLIKGVGLFDKKRFKGVELKDRTRNLIKLEPEGDGLICLNRSLLTEAYPDEIARNPKTEWEAWVLLSQNATMKVIEQWEGWKVMWDEWKKNLQDEKGKPKPIPEFEPTWDDDIWKGFRDWLLENIFHNKCAYCETKFAGFIGDAEHFRPKGQVSVKLADGDSEIIKILDENDMQVVHPGYFWLAYHWQNILPSYHLCNRYGGKKTQFPVQNSHVGVKRLTVEAIDKLLYKIRRSTQDEYMFYLEPRDLDTLEGRKLLHPYYDEPDKHLYFKVDGTADSVKGSEHGKASIDVYDLNEKDKVNARRHEQADGRKRYLHRMAEIGSGEAEIKHAARQFMDEYYCDWRPYGAAVYDYIHVVLEGTVFDPPKQRRGAK